MALDDPDLPTQGIFPNPEELKDCIAVTIRQPRSDLDSSILLPDGWYQQPAPADRIDFSKEAEFARLLYLRHRKIFSRQSFFRLVFDPYPKRVMLRNGLNGNAICNNWRSNEWCSTNSRLAGPPML